MRWWRAFSRLGVLLDVAFALVFVLVPVGIGLVGLRMVGDAGVLEERGATAPGRVVELRVSRDYSQNPPSIDEENVFAFVVDGREHTFVEGGDKAVGTPVTVWFDPRDPATVATTNPPGTHRVIGYVLVVAAALFLCGALWVGGRIVVEWMSAVPRRRKARRAQARFRRNMPGSGP
ncbi:DUF3592 domain-containing protein [Pseudonocardia sp. TRM90224]|uniref:DUF3592 domain-containing protein n=1 Tax=Pseudonocardia sp. TRM90224 TaxID=2812678 RepID=UPI001E4C8599|nr:DUF3592 domain-containing protein [Pseudonocardia sp. TRM90224]